MCEQFLYNNFIKYFFILTDDIYEEKFLILFDKIFNNKIST